jgi:hypothetical protein
MARKFGIRGITATAKPGSASAQRKWDIADGRDKAGLGFALTI